MWRQHLDGCASLIESSGINGLSGGSEQAVFWCFARMDLCGALISDERTIIPIKRWLPSPTLTINVASISTNFGYDMYANYVVHLCAQVMDLFISDLGSLEYTQKWTEMFTEICEWYIHRPPEMHPVLDTCPAGIDFTRPFPILLFSNSSAISGNQLYHTASLLLLQKQPPGARLPQGTRSMLWHARRICAISISNTHHGCWTNCIQPLWIAGRVMSHPAEHRAIIDTYELVERETGWGAKWRADDLQAFWGDLSGD
ncbi:hypothetical protein BKA67DRAFT_546123 [Truncatella angustata]|uniref:Uncharacterized protein n=1 Tax=Truncatella angustata TaxID=152316 RepID=A0A9P8UWL6_9PEZI|nr:uncharacterized protein BKA67DRAFT_546123 [Truncatella angustata]KAH6659891.1 hypothetical protein BKA67DRAFT_546123 [Truncatella angustata]